MIIQLNLDNLTQEMVDEALPNVGECSYSSPCLIGAMMTPQQRRYISKDSDYAAVGMCHEIQFPNKDQASKAERIQVSFDSLRRETLAELLPHLDFTK